MQDYTYGIENLTTDVLVIGGGIGGLSAAVTLKEINPKLEVLIVEKQTTGYAGKANKGGGVLQYFDLEHIDPKDFVAYHAHAVGCYLGDQELMLKYVAMNNMILDKLVEWGAKLPFDENGKYNVFPTGPMSSMIGVDLDITLKIRKTAEGRGVKIIDKIAVSDLLTTSDKISGAVGYSLLDGKFYTFAAKAVILATGSQNYRIGPMWGSGRGDGIAAAYRAGAQMRNPEFGNFAQLMRAKSHQEVVFGENVMYNTLGDNITKNFRRFPEADISSTAIAEWYNQMSAGKGPITLHPWESEMTRNESMMFTMWDRPYGLPFWKANFEKAEAVDSDDEVCPLLIGEQSPVKVGHDMQTTIQGLYAIGDASYCGSTAPGAVPAPPGRNRGSGILNAVFAGLISGEGAGEYARSKAALPLSLEQIEACAGRAYAPLNRPQGCDPKEVIALIQKAVGPMEYAVYMSQHRIDIARRIVAAARAKVSEMSAKDFHGLLTCHEAEAMVLSAEMQFGAADMRKESRGWFLREDYPQMDNQNWLKWITVQNINGKMVFATEDVPYESWPVKPPVMD